VRILCEACGAETNPAYGKYLQVNAFEAGRAGWGMRVWCAPCGVRVLDAIDSVTNHEMARDVPEVTS
jgi:hypothetical protein